MGFSSHFFFTGIVAGRSQCLNRRKSSISSLWAPEKPCKTSGRIPEKWVRTYCDESPVVSTQKCVQTSHVESAKDVAKEKSTKKESKCIHPESFSTRVRVFAPELSACT